MSAKTTKTKTRRKRETPAQIKANSERVKKYMSEIKQYCTKLDLGKSDYPEYVVKVVNDDMFPLIVRSKRKLIQKYRDVLKAKVKRQEKKEKDAAKPKKPKRDYTPSGKKRCPTGKRRRYVTVKGQRINKGCLTNAVWAQLKAKRKAKRAAEAKARPKTKRVVSAVYKNNVYGTDKNGKRYIKKKAGSVKPGWKKNPDGTGYVRVKTARKKRGPRMVTVSKEFANAAETRKARIARQKARLAAAKARKQARDRVLMPPPPPRPPKTQQGIGIEGLLALAGTKARG